MDVFELQGCTYTVDEAGRLWRIGATWVLLASSWRAGGAITVEGCDRAATPSLFRRRGAGSARRRELGPARP